MKNANFTLSQRVVKLETSATVAMTSRAKMLKDAGKPVVSLSLGEPDFGTPKCILEAAKRALDKGVSRYTPIRGTDELIQAMCKKFERDQKVCFDASQVLSTVGAKAALSLAIDATIEEGDEVIVLSPYWVSYPELIRLAGGTPIFVPSHAENGFLPSIEDFRRAISPRTKAVMLNSPNNPSGAVFPESLLRSLMAALENSSIWVISDEIYEHLVFDDAKHVSPATFSKDAESRTLVISGASKGYAMTGWRVGVVGGPKLLVDAMVKLQSQRYTCIAAISQAAAAYALLEPPELVPEIERMRKAYETRRNLMLSGLSRIPNVRCSKPRGAFYVLPDFSAYFGKEVHGKKLKDDIDLANRLLDECFVATVPGTPFGAPGTLRMSLASSEADISSATSRITEWLKQ